MASIYKFLLMKSMVVEYQGIENDPMLHRRIEALREAVEIATTEGEQAYLIELFEITADPPTKETAGRVCTIFGTFWDDLPKICKKYFDDWLEPILPKPVQQHSNPSPLPGMMRANQAPSK